MKVKEESVKVGLELNIQKTKIMSSGPITSWQIDEEIKETVTDFILVGSKITADCDCSLEIKRHLLLWSKAMTNLDSLLKSRDITLPTEVHLVKAMVFPVVMYECEGWTIILRHSTFLMVQWSYPDITTGKTIALTRWIFVGKVVSLLFNTLSRIFVVLLSSYKCLLVSWL